LRGKAAIGLPDVTQNRSDAAEYQAIPEQSRKIADAESPEATNLALPRRSFASGSPTSGNPDLPRVRIPTKAATHSNLIAATIPI
jgi:hypothetical protein